MKRSSRLPATAAASALAAVTAHDLIQRQHALLRTGTAPPSEDAIG